MSFNIESQNTEYYFSDEVNTDFYNFCASTGAMSSVVWGCCSTLSVTLLSARIWPHAYYIIPAAALTGTVVFKECVGRVLASRDSSSRIAALFFATVGAALGVPFLVGACPGMTLWFSSSYTLNKVLQQRDSTIGDSSTV